MSGIAARVVLSPDSDLYRALDRAATERRCVFFAGLSGVGKSLMLQQLALFAHQRGRSVHSLQWDVAREPFDRPDILVRYPEVEGVTHAAIRKAVGLWARGVVSRWERTHPEPHQMLIGETPLIGARLIELARRESDDVEALLGGEQTLFLIPSPSSAVRQAIVDFRRREMESPAHEREALSARPALLDAHWRELDLVAVELGMSGARSASGYDPDVYVAVYQRVLRHRRARILRIQTVLPVAASAQELGELTKELRPTQQEVDQAIALVSGYAEETLEAEATNWFRT